MLSQGDSFMDEIGKHNIHIKNDMFSPYQTLRRKIMSIRMNKKEQNTIIYQDSFLVNMRGESKRQIYRDMRNEFGLSNNNYEYLPPTSDIGIKMKLDLHDREITLDFVFSYCDVNINDEYLNNLIQDRKIIPEISIKFGEKTIDLKDTKIKIDKNKKKIINKNKEKNIIDRKLRFY